MLSTCHWLIQVTFSATVWRGPVFLWSVLFPGGQTMRSWPHDHRSSALWPHKHLRDLPGEPHAIIKPEVARWEYFILLLWLKCSHDWDLSLRPLHYCCWVSCRVARFGAVHSPLFAPTDTWLRPYVISVRIFSVARSALRLPAYSPPHPQFVTHHWAPPFVFLSCQLQP